MKRTALLLSLVAVSAAGAQGTFEGTVTYQMGANGDTWQYSAKGNKVRIDISSAHMPGGMAAIMDLGAMTTTMIMNQQHMYMTMPIPQTANVPDSVHGKFVKTGSEVIAGVPCDDYVGEDSHGTKENGFCLAHGMGNFAQYSSNNPMMKAYSARISGLSGALGQGGFPLKVTKSDGTVEMLATKVEKKSLDASMFTVPAGYTTMQMPAGMQVPQH